MAFRQGRNSGACGVPKGIGRGDVLLRMSAYIWFPLRPCPRTSDNLCALPFRPRVGPDSDKALHCCAARKIMA